MQSFANILKSTELYTAKGELYLYDKAGKAAMTTKESDNKREPASLRRV